MSYRIEIEGRARKALARLDPPVLREADRVIVALAENPRPLGCRAMKGPLKGHFRVRFGPRAGWRLLYRIDDHVLVITVVEVDTRGDIY